MWTTHRLDSHPNWKVYIDQNFSWFLNKLTILCTPWIFNMGYCDFLKNNWIGICQVWFLAQKVGPNNNNNNNNKKKKKNKSNRRDVILTLAFTPFLWRSTPHLWISSKKNYNVSLKTMLNGDVEGLSSTFVPSQFRYPHTKGNLSAITHKHQPLHILFSWNWCHGNKVEAPIHVGLLKWQRSYCL
jgi:hypothetical protein